MIDEVKKKNDLYSIVEFENETLQWKLYGK